MEVATIREDGYREDGYGPFMYQNAAPVLEIMIEKQMKEQNITHYDNSFNCVWIINLNDYTNELARVSNLHTCAEKEKDMDGELNTSKDALGYISDLKYTDLYIVFDTVIGNKSTDDNVVTFSDATIVVSNDDLIVDFNNCQLHY